MADLFSDPSPSPSPSPSPGAGGPRVEQALQFLEWRWGRSGDVDGWLTLCSRSGGAGSKMIVEGAYPTQRDGLEEMARKAVSLADGGADTWVMLNGLGGAPPRGRKGGEVGLRWIVGLHEDIDKGISDPLAVLDGMGQWRPSVVVDSGHGVHAYWLFDEPIDLAEASGGDVARLHELRGWYRMLAGRWHRYMESEKVGGARFDDCSNLDRIMRLPGTFNHKRSGVRPVLIARPFDGRTFPARGLWDLLDSEGVPEHVPGAGGGRLSAAQAAEAFARQGTLGGEETAALIDRLTPVYVHRANTYANSSRSRNRAMFDFVQQLNDHGVAREDAVEAVLVARGMVTEQTEAGEYDPLTVEEMMTVVGSAYSYPPRGAAANPDAGAEAVVLDAGDVRMSWAAGVVGGGAGVADGEASGTGTGMGGSSDGGGAGSGGAGSGGSGGSGGSEGEGGGEELLHRVSDAANGEELVELCRGKIIKVEGVGWHIWDGMRWRFDPEQSNRKTSVARRIMVAEFRRRAEDEDLEVEERQAWAKRIARLEADAGMPAAFRAAGPDLLVEHSEMDRDPWLLNCPNGTVDLRTGEIREHRPSDLITRVTAVDYIPGAGGSSEIWNRVLDHAVRDGEVGTADLGFLQRWFGSACTGLTTEKAILLMSGPKNSGKTTITEAVSEALGNAKDGGGYSWQWANSMVEKDEHGDSAATALSDTVGARLVVVAELNEGARLKAGFVKSVTGGDRVPARMLYQQGFSYTPEFKMVVHTNHVPKTHDDALQDRLRLFRTVRTLEYRDPRVAEAVRSDDAVRQAVLAWCVEGAKAWYEAGQVAGYPSMQAVVMHELALGSDQVYAFLSDYFEVRQDYETADARDAERCGFVTRRQVWIDYRNWHTDNAEMGRQLGQRQLFGKIRDRGFVEAYVSREAGFVGLKRRSGMGVEIPSGWSVLDGEGAPEI